jgi:1-deoxyxylulose-5-phosphate synthase
MQYQDIAGGALRVSRIGVGGNIFGHFSSHHETAEILTRADHLGINIVDTADVYSEGESERQIGSALHQRRHQWVIASKAGVGSAENPAGFARAGNLRAKLEGSLVRLQTEYLDLYQLHHFDPVTPLEETLAALERFRTEGKIRHFGVSNYSGASLQSIAELAKDGGTAGPSTVQCHYNLFSRAAEKEIFPVSSGQQISVLAYGVLARGILAEKYTRDTPHPASSRAATSANIRNDLNPEVLEAVADIGALSRSLGATAGQLAIAWILRRREVACALVGMRDVSQLQQIAQAVSLSLTEEQAGRLEELAARVPRHSDTGFGAPLVFG